MICAFALSLVTSCFQCCNTHSVFCGVLCVCVLITGVLHHREQLAQPEVHHGEENSLSHFLAHTSLISRTQVLHVPRLEWSLLVHASYIQTQTVHLFASICEH